MSKKLNSIDKWLEIFRKIYKDCLDCPELTKCDLCNELLVKCDRRSDKKND